LGERKLFFYSKEERPVNSKLTGLSDFI